MNYKTKMSKSILFFFLKMLFIFILLDLLMMIFAELISKSSLVNKYGMEIITEIFYSLAVLIVMLLFKNSYVFTNKKEKFTKGVFLAIPMLVMTVFYLINSILSLDSFSFAKFVNVVILSIFIGIAEEFLCRGWIQNEFIERFSDSKKNVILSIVLSSFVFGFMHIVNLGTQTLFETILQMINATALGLLLGSIYYKTKNIWSVIFLHASYDFSIFLGEMNLIKSCTYNTPTIGIIAVNSVAIVVVSLIWVLSAILVLRKCNFPDYNPNKKLNNSSIKIIIVIAFIVLLIPFEKLVPEYKDYEVCYKYNEIGGFENYTIHYPNYNKYTIESEIKTIDYLSVEGEGVQEIVSLTTYKYEFEIKDEILVARNVNTGYEYTFKFKNVSDVEVIETDDKYMIVVQTYENESTIYYSEYITNENLSNQDDFMKDLENTFVKYELPEINQIGYITFANSDITMPIVISVNYDYFIIKNGELYLLKR